MEMEVVVPVSPVDFNFDSNCSSPYMTAPSSPSRFGNFLSAPTSPNRAAAFFQELNELARHSSAVASSVPFDWEQKPGVPKSKPKTNSDFDQSEDFEFDFSGQLDKTLSAEELFDGGKIRPLKPPPRLQIGGVLSAPVSSASSPRLKISQGKKIVQEAFSPRHQNRDFDPFSAALEETHNREGRNQQNTGQGLGQRRGRQRASSFSYTSTSSGRKATRSLSPLRVSDIVGESEDISERDKGVSSTTSNTKASTISSYASFLSSIPFTKGYRKWRFKDFLLFRSASEGRATGGKDPIGKYAALSKKAVAEDEARNSSFRSTESASSVSRRRGAVSAHELHYTVNRAASEEMKKKTLLPYKQGLWGCLGFNFNPGMHEISRGIGSLTRS